jgi:Tol biopolymer transport system component
MRVYVRLALLLGAVGVLLLSGGETGAAPGITRRVSVDSAAGQGDGPSEYPAFSRDGRYVAFHSSATNLVPGDTNGCQDVFVHDRMTGVTERVSVATDGAEGTRGSLHPAISADGRYVAFDSWAPDLVAGDTNDRVDVFVRDRQTNTTQRVSLSSSGVEGNDTSWYPAISGDGRFVAFQSFASNLVSGDTNSAEDVFVRDRQTSTTIRVSVSSGGVQGNAGSWDPAITPDGRYVAFYSEASTLVTSDTNGYQDVFVRDRDTDGDGEFDEPGVVSTTRVSVSSGGAQGNNESYYAAISGNGRFVAFGSAATNLVAGDSNGSSDVFVRDRQGVGTTTRVSLNSAGIQGNAGSFAPAISSDGGLVAFQSQASNLATGDTNGFGDVFVRDRDTDEDGIFDEAEAVSTARVSVSSFGGEGDAESLDPSISGDGNQVAFVSFASNLVPVDTNGSSDIFLHDALGAVGGIAELPHVSGPSAPDYVPLAGLAAAALALLAASAWFTAKRRPRWPLP